MHCPFIGTSAVVLIVTLREFINIYLVTTKGNTRLCALYAKSVTLAENNIYFENKCIQQKDLKW